MKKLLLAVVLAFLGYVSFNEYRLREYQHVRGDAFVAMCAVHPEHCR